MNLPKPLLFGIDHEGEAGRQLLATVAGQSGHRLAAVAAMAQRLFAMASPWAPGLVAVGAEAGFGQGQVMGVAGVGTSLPDATTSCLGELLERVSQAEQPGDVATRRPLSGATLSKAVETLGHDVAVANGGSQDVEIDWMAGQDLATGNAVTVPADWCLRRTIPGPLRLADTPLSIGTAAGRTIDDAAVRALLELVERDAVALWWCGGKRARPLALEALSTGVGELLAGLRCGSRARATWCLDVTSDPGIPCIVAVSVGEDGKGLACGMAARLSLPEAAKAALLELCQMELALLLSALKREQGGEQVLNVVDLGHLRRASELDAATCMLLQPIGAPRVHGAMDRPDSLAALKARFAQCGIEAALVDLTRPRFGIPVVKALAPRLQQWPSGVVVSRLQDAIDETGGGVQWTNGVPLM